MRDEDTLRNRKWRAILVLALFLALSGAVHVGAAPLDPLSIPKWENTIAGPPPVYAPVSGDYYEVNVSEFNQTILPPSMGLQTTVYGYGGLAKDAVTGQSLGFIRNSPGPSFEAEACVPIKVKYSNDLTAPHMFAVDPSVMWADPNNMGMVMPPFPGFPPGYPTAQAPVPICVHLHGGEVPAAVDGGPEAWFTSNGLHGPTYYTAEPTDANAAVYQYPNDQEPATLWYHDHTLGMTRINVVSGMAGFYLLRDDADPIAPLLPQGKYEVPLAIQDRVFNDDGTFNFTIAPTNPDVHPYWGPEYFGDTIMVNGLVWPKMNVDRGAYRFRFLDGSNARFYDLSFSNGMPFTVIGTEGGYVKSATNVNRFLIAPGERFDVIVDFSNIAPGTSVTLLNSASGPYPSGDPVDPATTGQIMRFDVGSGVGPSAPNLPAQLNPTLSGAFPNLPTPSVNRSLVLTEIEGPGGPLELLLDGQSFGAAVSELPKQGATEEWQIANPTMDTHPIHLHLVQFQVVKRQAYDAVAHYNAWVAVNNAAGNGAAPPWSGPTVPVDVTPALFGPVMYPDATEQGWKDTVKMNPGEVTWIRVRFASQDGSPFSFDPTLGYYVWHCHIIDHEDNEMMRPYRVVAAGPTVLAVPPETALPTDTNADGLYDDVNGNGRRDFADIVLYFNQMTWISANEPLSAFDYNKNGRIDFADVVWLFNNL
jgi:spore coat protein A